MNYYRVALFGHRDFYEHRRIEKRLYAILRDLIGRHPLVEFYIGRNGEFDIFSASLIKQVQKNYGNDNSEISLILPYPNKDIDYYEKYYDSVIIPECLTIAHPKGAITKRNKWMVEECDMLICYVERKNGGAYADYEVCKKTRKKDN